MTIFEKQVAILKIQNKKKKNRRLNKEQLFWKKVKKNIFSNTSKDHLTNFVLKAYVYPCY